MSRIMLVVASVNWAPILVGAVLGLAYFLPRLVVGWWHRYQDDAQRRRLTAMATRLYEARSEPRWER